MAPEGTKSQILDKIQHRMDKSDFHHSICLVNLICPNSEFHRLDGNLFDTQCDSFKQLCCLPESFSGNCSPVQDFLRLQGQTQGMIASESSPSQEIAAAVRDQVTRLDFAPTFQMGHPGAFELATRLVELLPSGINRVFYTNSGSESVDTALKIAIAYHRLKGEGSRQRLIGRERAYHGVNFGGAAVGSRRRC